MLSSKFHTKAICSWPWPLGPSKPPDLWSQSLKLKRKKPAIHVLKGTSTYPLVNIQKTIENHHFQWAKSTISMAIFNSYVKLPKGMAAPVLTPHPALLHGRVDARRHLRGKGPDLAKLVALISWAYHI